MLPQFLTWSVQMEHESKFLPTPKEKPEPMFAVVRPFLFTLDLRRKTRCLTLLKIKKKIKKKKGACNCTKTDTCMNEFGRSVDGQTLGGGWGGTTSSYYTSRWNVTQSVFLFESTTYSTLIKSCLQMHLFRMAEKWNGSICNDQTPHHGGLKPTIMLEWIKVDGLLGQRHQRLLRCHTTTDDAKMHTCTMCDQYGL